MLYQRGLQSVAGYSGLALVLVWDSGPGFNRYFSGLFY